MMTIGIEFKFLKIICERKARNCKMFQQMRNGRKETSHVIGINTSGTSLTKIRNNVGPRIEP